MTRRPGVLPKPLPKKWRFLFFPNHYPNLLKKETLNALTNQRFLLRVDLGDAELEMKRREKEKTVLSVHPYKITNSNEKWMTYIKDDTKKEKRKKVVKNSREELIDALFDHYKHPGKKAITLERIFPEWLRFDKECL